MSISIHELTTWPEDLSAQARILYERSFPPEERNDFGRIQQAAVDGRVHALAAQNGNSLVGLSIFKHIKEARLGYLWYLCVDDSTRGSGIGSRLCEKTIEVLENIGGLRGLIFEVGRINSKPHPMFGDPIRRIRFYQRLGARLIMGYDYWQPPIPPHGPVPLQLMFRSFAGEPSEVELAGIISDFLRWSKDRHEEVEPTGLRLADLSEVTQL